MKRLNQMCLAGACIGFGNGLIIGTYLSWGYHPGLVIPGSFLSGIGICMANWARRAEQAEQKPPASQTGLE